MPEILDQHIGRLDEPRQGLRAFRRLQIERHALLAAIEREVEAPPAVNVRRPGARVVAVLRLFDLQHLGAHVAQHHGAERTGDDAGEIDHPQSMQWRHAWRL